MTRLEEIVSKNRNFFDSHEPPEGHFDRFKKRLPSVDASRVWELIAAVLVGATLILLSIGYYWNDEIKPSNLSNLSPEIQETLLYYHIQNEAMLEKIQEMEVEHNSSMKKIHEDLKSYDEDYRHLLKDLKSYPDDPRVINAIIENHRAKVEMLGFIVKQMNQMNV